ncbi:MAG TPA: elongation factor P [bacterium]
MIPATQLRPGMIIKREGELLSVLRVVHVTPGNWRGMVQVKFRNIMNGKGFEHRFRSEDKVEVVIMEETEMEYLYSDSETYTFMNTETYEQVPITIEILGDTKNFLTPNLKVKVEMYEDRPVGIELPLTVDLKVVDAPPQMKGATATNSPKPATLETGIVVQVPQFINTGDVVRVDTRTGNYLERAG